MRNGEEGSDVCLLSPLSYPSKRQQERRHSWPAVNSPREGLHGNSGVEPSRASVCRSSLHGASPLI